MGDGTHLRHGRQPQAERVVEGLQGFLLQIDEAGIVAHEADEPNAFVDFLDSEAPAGHAIERMFCQLKDYRRIATRYDRLAGNFLAAVCLAATVSCWI